MIDFYAKTLYALLLNQQIGVQAIRPSLGAKYASLATRLSDPTDIGKALKLSESLAVQVGTSGVLALREKGYAVYQVALDRHFWTTYTRTDLRAQNGIGFAANKREMTFELTRYEAHNLFVGTTGSGKSEGIKSTLYSLIATHSQSELSIAICDPHGDYLDFTNEAHLAAPIAHTEDEMNTLIQYVMGELSRRKEANDRGAAKLVLVIDELPTVADKKKNESGDYNRAAIDSLAAEAGKFNIHLLIGIQKPTKNDLEKKTNFTRRFIGYLPDGNESFAISGQAGLRPNALAGQGDFIQVGMQDAKRFQFVMLEDRDFERLERRPIAAITPSVKVIEPERLIDAVSDTGAGGRPKSEILPEILGLVMANRNVSYPVAKEAVAALTSKRHLQKHKTLWDAALAQFLTIKGVELCE